MPPFRVTVSLPASLVRQADRRARLDRRSRSWVVADALRQYLTEPARADHASPVSFSAAARQVSEQHLRTQLALSPAARLTHAEELGTLARERQGRGPREQVIAFDSYEDYYLWKLARLIGA